MKNKNLYLALIPVMLSFFVMGFVDLVGVATYNVQKDLDLSEKIANLLPSMVFFWFLIFSVPTGMLMNKIGRRKTVLLSLGVTILALVIPMVNYSFTSMLISFSLLGIGNTLMQVSLNPLLSGIVSGDKLASSLTLGQFIKAIASFLAPIIAGKAALLLGDWKYLFPIFMSIAVVAIILLGVTKIDEKEEKQENTTFLQCFGLLGNMTILLCFIGIICHVGIDVGINVTIPRILEERLGMSTEDAGYGTSLYFLFRTIGCFTGTFILARFSAKKFFFISVVCMILAVAGLFFFTTMLPIYICIALIGYGNSNIFPIIFSNALLYMPEKKNAISGLMIMGLFGGTIFPFCMGIMAEAISSQAGALIILGIGVAYLLLFAFKLKEKTA